MTVPLSLLFSISPGNIFPATLLTAILNSIRICTYLPSERCMNFFNDDICCQTLFETFYIFRMICFQP